MAFDVSQTQFPSVTHQSIWHAALFLAPYRGVIPLHYAGQKASDLGEGEASLHRFFRDLYRDMYDHPEAYCLPVGEYDTYMDGRQRQELHHKSDPKESRLRNQFQQSIQFFQRFLFSVGAQGDLDPDTHAVSMDRVAYQDALRHKKLTRIRGQEEERARCLTRMGFAFDLAGERLTISNDRYPKMLLALIALCRARGKYAYTHYLRCDFRGLTGHRPGFDDAISVLSGDQRQMAMDMDGYLCGLGGKATVEPLKNTTLHSVWKVKYKVKGKLIYGFFSDVCQWRLYAYFNTPENVSRMGYLLKSEYPDLYGWFVSRVPERLCACPNNRLVDLGGQKKRICGLMNRLEAASPDETEYAYLKCVVGLYADSGLSLGL